LLPALAALLLLGIPAALIYLHAVGFNAAWRQQVAESLGGGRWRVSIGKLTFQIFEGVVAQDVDVFQKSGAGLRIADIDQLSIAPNLAALLAGRVKVDHLSLKDASLSIPFADDGRQPGTIRLDRVNATILNAQDQLTISLAECLFEGIHISISGTLLNPDNTRPLASTQPSSFPSQVETIRSILKALSSWKFSGETPQLEINLSGNLSKPADISAPHVTFTSGHATFRNFSFTKISLQAAYRDSVLQLEKSILQGPWSDLKAVGDWNPATHSGSLDLSGTLDPSPILKAIDRTELAEKIRFIEQADIQARASITPDSGMRIIGQVSAGKFQFQECRVR